MKIEPLHSRFSSLPFLGVLAITIIPTICFNMIAFKCVVGNEMSYTSIAPPTMKDRINQPVLETTWTPDDDINSKSPKANKAISKHFNRTIFKVSQTNQDVATAVFVPTNSNEAQRRPNAERPFHFDVHSRPGSQKVSMICTALDQIGVRIAITDLLGKELIGGIQYFLEGKHELEFDVPELVEGQYFVSMEKEDHILTKKLNITALHGP